MKGGLQACSVTKEFLEDTYGTLKKMADYGYKYIESAGTMFTPELKVDMKELKKMMDEVGIEHPSKHYCPYLTSDLNSEIERLHIIGGDYLALASDFFTSRDEVLSRCEMYNETGKICKENGISFIYHNHAHEFQKFVDKSALELLVENTDPEYVNFEIDTMWAFRGGDDPVETLKKFGKRVKLLHLDDFHPKYMDHRSFFDGLPENPVITGEFYGQYNIDVATDIGTGVMDVQSILDASEKYTDVKYGFIELSSANSRYKDDMMKAAEFGINQLKKYKGVSFV